MLQRCSVDILVSVIRSLVDEIIQIYPQVAVFARLKGDLAAILNMATNKKPADEVHGLETLLRAKPAARRDLAARAFDSREPDPA